MSGSARLLFTILAVVFLGYFAIKVVFGVVHALIALLFPLLVVGVVAAVLYTLINRKSLGSGRRTLP